VTRALLTCFDAFAGSAVNASERAVMAVDPEALPADLELVRVRLPTVFGACVDALREALEAHAPDVVVCVGQAGAHPAVAIETIAKNWDAPKLPDNAGQQPDPRACVPGAPASLRCSLPTSAVLEALSDQGIAARLSEDAGDFVCNHLFYGLMHELTRREDARGGFIHLPCLPEDGEPGLPTPVAAKALETIVRACVTHGGAPSVQASR
jgi:pyroglutamyl-peptidase